jgi:hypothetical protein
MQNKIKALSSPAALARARAMQRVGNRFQDPKLKQRGQAMENLARAAIKNGRMAFPS